MKNALLILVALGLIAGFAIQTHASATIDETSLGQLLALYQRTRLNIPTSSVSLANCGASTINGSDGGGQVTYAVATTTCTINFSQAWNYIPVCTLTLASGTLTGGSGGVAFSSLTTTAASIKTAQNVMTSSILNYMCHGNPN